jgi:exodeoxyribonuclease VII small subunit
MLWSLLLTGVQLPAWYPGPCRATEEAKCTAPMPFPNPGTGFALKYRAKLQLSIMSKNPKPAALPASFEEAMAELEELVAQMEAGELPLEASVAAYKRGSELVKFCAGQLDKVESQVKVLEGDMLKPFASDATIEADE